MPLSPTLYSYISQEKTYSNNSVIVREGEENRWVFIILEGQCKVKKRTTEGIVVLDVLKPGAIIGEMALFEKTSKLATATVVADGQAKVGVLDPRRLAQDKAELSPGVTMLIESLILSLKRANTRASQVAM